MNEELGYLEERIETLENDVGKLNACDKIQAEQINLITSVLLNLELDIPTQFALRQIMSS